MAWKWYEIDTYKASVGGNHYYGGIQMTGPGLLRLDPVSQERPAS